MASSKNASGFPTVSPQMGGARRIDLLANTKWKNALMGSVAMATIELIDELPFTQQAAVFAPTTPITSAHIKIVSSGELNAQGQDRRLLLRLNTATNGYQGFVHMGGHHGAGEWDNSGFYLGRNGWGLDATFSVEFTIAINSNAQKVTGSGFTVFAHGNNTILGYECHSFLVTNPPVSRLELLFTGGVATGVTRIYRM